MSLFKACVGRGIGIARSVDGALGILGHIVAYVVAVDTLEHSLAYVDVGDSHAEQVTRTALLRIREGDTCLGIEAALGTFQVCRVGHGLRDFHAAASIALHVDLELALTEYGTIAVAGIAQHFQGYDGAARDGLHARLHVHVIAITYGGGDVTLVLDGGVFFCLLLTVNAAACFVHIILGVVQIAFLLEGDDLGVLRILQVGDNQLCIVALVRPVIEHTEFDHGGRDLPSGSDNRNGSHPRI